MSHSTYPIPPSGVPWPSGNVDHGGAGFVAFGPPDTISRTLLIQFKGQSVPPESGGPLWSGIVVARPTPATSYPAAGTETAAINLLWDPASQVHFGSVTLENFALSSGTGYWNEATLVAVNITDFGVKRDNLLFWYAAELME